MSARQGLTILLTLLIAVLWGVQPLFASIDDDNYDGNIFVLYAGNGSLVPPKLNLQESLRLGKPAVLVFYIEDSRDCKKFAINLNRWQAQFTPQVSIIPINADSLTSEVSEAQYFHGLVPETVVIDRQGTVRLDLVGATHPEQVDQTLRQLVSNFPS